jgi:hypothetical protein
MLSFMKYDLLIDGLYTGQMLRSNYTFIGDLL